MLLISFHLKTVANCVIGMFLEFYINVVRGRIFVLVSLGWIMSEFIWCLPFLTVASWLSSWLELCIKQPLLGKLICEKTSGIKMSGNTAGHWCTDETGINLQRFVYHVSRFDFLPSGTVILGMCRERKCRNKLRNRCKYMETAKLPSGRNCFWPLEEKKKETKK